MQDLNKIFVFVGDKKCGKTNLIMKLLEIQANDIKETIALDFKYADKQKEDKKIRVNTYEIGGGRQLSNLLSAPLSVQNIHKIGSICIVIDLSKPA